MSDSIDQFYACEVLNTVFLFHDAIFNVVYHPQVPRFYLFTYQQVQSIERPEM